MARLNMGEAKDDIHVCILCMRAIMNNKVNIKSDVHIDSYLKFNSAFEKKKGNDFKIIFLFVHIHKRIQAHMYNKIYVYLH